MSRESASIIYATERYSLLRLKACSTVHTWHFQLSPTWFPYFCVSLWPVSRCRVKGVLACCRCSIKNTRSRLCILPVPRSILSSPHSLVGEQEKFQRQKLPTKSCKKTLTFLATFRSHNNRCKCENAAGKMANFCQMCACRELAGYFIGFGRTWRRKKSHSNRKAGVLNVRIFASAPCLLCHVGLGASCWPYLAATAAPPAPNIPRIE